MIEGEGGKEANLIIIHERGLFFPFRMYLVQISKVELSFLVYVSVCMYVCLHMCLCMDV